MKSIEFEDSFFDSDILKAIEDISFISESYTKCKEINRELENKAIYLIEDIKELGNTEKELIEKHTTSKKLIAEQQLTISNLVAVKDEIKMHKEEVFKRDEKIKRLEEDLVQLSSKYAEEKSTTQYLQNSKVEDIKKSYEQSAQNMRDEIDALVSEGICKSRELNEDILRTKTGKEEKLERCIDDTTKQKGPFLCIDRVGIYLVELHYITPNVLVLEYEERLQMTYAQNVRMRDEMQDYRKRVNANISVYQKRIEILEQLQYHPVNIVAPNNARSTSTFTPASKLMDPGESKPSRMIAVSNATKDDKAAPYKLASKQKKLRRAFKPLQIKITESASGVMQGNQKRLSPVGGEAASKGSKRKLFSKHSDEFQDFDETDQSN